MCDPDARKAIRVSAPPVRTRIRSCPLNTSSTRTFPVESAAASAAVSLDKAMDTTEFSITLRVLVIIYWIQWGLPQDLHQCPSHPANAAAWQTQLAANRERVDL